MRLSAPRLAIREDGPVIALNHRLHEGKGSLVVHLPLSAFGAVHFVVSKMLLLLCDQGSKLNLVLVFQDLHNSASASFNLFFVHGPTPNNDFDTF